MQWFWCSRLLVRLVRLHLAPLHARGRAAGAGDAIHRVSRYRELRA